MEPKQYPNLISIASAQGWAVQWTDEDGRVITIPFPLFGLYDDGSIEPIAEDGDPWTGEDLVVVPAACTDPRHAEAERIVRDLAALDPLTPIPRSPGAPN